MNQQPPNPKLPKGIPVRSSSFRTSAPCYFPVSGAHPHIPPFPPPVPFMASPFPYPPPVQALGLPPGLAPVQSGPVLLQQNQSMTMSSFQMPVPPTGLESLQNTQSRPTSSQVSPDQMQQHFASVLTSALESSQPSHSGSKARQSTGSGDVVPSEEQQDDGTVLIELPGDNGELTRLYKDESTKQIFAPFDDTEKITIAELKSRCIRLAKLVTSPKELQKLIVVHGHGKGKYTVFNKFYSYSELGDKFSELRKILKIAEQYQEAQMVADSSEDFDTLTDKKIQEPPFKHARIPREDRYRDIIDSGIDARLSSMRNVLENQTKERVKETDDTVFAFLKQNVDKKSDDRDSSSLTGENVNKILDLYSDLMSQPSSLDIKLPDYRAVATYKPPSKNKPSSSYISSSFKEMQSMISTDESSKKKRSTEPFTEDSDFEPRRSSLSFPSSSTMEDIRAMISVEESYRDRLRPQVAKYEHQRDILDSPPRKTYEDTIPLRFKHAHETSRKADVSSESLINVWERGWSPEAEKSPDFSIPSAPRDSTPDAAKDGDYAFHSNSPLLEYKRESRTDSHFPLHYGRELYRDRSDRSRHSSSKSRHRSPDRHRRESPDRHRRESPGRRRRESPDRWRRESHDRRRRRSPDRYGRESPDRRRHRRDSPSPKKDVLNYSPEPAHDMFEEALMADYMKRLDDLSHLEKHDHSSLDRPFPSQPQHKPAEESLQLSKNLPPDLSYNSVQFNNDFATQKSLPMPDQKRLSPKSKKPDDWNLWLDAAKHVVGEPSAGSPEPETTKLTPTLQPTFDNTQYIQMLVDGYLAYSFNEWKKVFNRHLAYLNKVSPIDKSELHTAKNPVVEDANVSCKAGQIRSGVVLQICDERQSILLQLYGIKRIGYLHSSQVFSSHLGSLNHVVQPGSSVYVKLLSSELNVMDKRIIYCSMKEVSQRKGTDLNVTQTLLQAKLPQHVVGESSSPSMFTDGSIVSNVLTEKLDVDRSKDPLSKMDTHVDDDFEILSKRTRRSKELAQMICAQEVANLEFVARLQLNPQTKRFTSMVQNDPITILLNAWITMFSHRVWYHSQDRNVNARGVIERAGKALGAFIYVEKRVKNFQYSTPVYSGTLRLSFHLSRCAPEFARKLETLMEKLQLQLNSQQTLGVILSTAHSTQTDKEAERMAYVNGVGNLMLPFIEVVKHASDKWRVLVGYSFDPSATLFVDNIPHDLILSWYPVQSFLVAEEKLLMSVFKLNRIDWDADCLSSPDVHSEVDMRLRLNRKTVLRCTAPCRLFGIAWLAQVFCIHAQQYFCSIKMGSEKLRRESFERIHSSLSKLKFAITNETRIAHHTVYPPGKCPSPISMIIPKLTTFSRKFKLPVVHTEHSGHSSEHGSHDDRSSKKHSPDAHKPASRTSFAKSTTNNNSKSNVKTGRKYSGKRKASLEREVKTTDMDSRSVIVLKPPEQDQTPARGFDVRRKVVPGELRITLGNAGDADTCSTVVKRLLGQMVGLVSNSSVLLRPSLKPMSKTENDCFRVLRDVVHIVCTVDQLVRCAAPLRRTRIVKRLVKKRKKQPALNNASSENNSENNIGAVTGRDANVDEGDNDNVVYLPFDDSEIANAIKESELLTSDIWPLSGYDSGDDFANLIELDNLSVTDSVSDNGQDVIMATQPTEADKNADGATENKEKLVSPSQTIRQRLNRSLSKSPVDSLDNCPETGHVVSRKSEQSSTGNSRSSSSRREQRKSTERQRSTDSSFHRGRGGSRGKTNPRLPPSGPRGRGIGRGRPSTRTRGRGRGGRGRSRPFDRGTRPTRARGSYKYRGGRGRAQSFDSTYDFDIGFGDDDVSRDYSSEDSFSDSPTDHKSSAFSRLGPMPSHGGPPPVYNVFDSMVFEKDDSSFRSIIGNTKSPDKHSDRRKHDSSGASSHKKEEKLPDRIVSIVKL